MLNASLILPEMLPWLPRVDAFGNFMTDDDDTDTAPETAMSPSAAQTLAEMERLGM